MKNLLLMRHAKSSWKEDDLEDHERPLKKRGWKDAKRIAKVIKKNDLVPDVILCSTAVRARETADAVVEVLDFPHPVIYSDELYMGEPEVFIEALSNLDNDYNTALIVAHNPGMEAYLQVIDGEIEALPTAGLGYLVLAIDQWNELSFDSMGDLIGFWTPKTLKDKH